MKRTVAWFAVLGVLALPDWAAACWPHWYQPVYPTPFYGPPTLYTTPVYPPVYVGPVYPVPPVYGYVSPQVYPIVLGEAVPSKNAMLPTMAEPTAAPPAPTAGKAGTKEASPASPGSTGGDAKSGGPKAGNSAKSDTVQTAAGLDLLPRAPMPPSSSDSGGKLPPLELPKEPERKNTKSGDGPAKPLPNAKPSPAPADPNIPEPMPMGLTLPGVTPAAPSRAPSESILTPARIKPDSLPPISLPPEVPVKPDSVSRSSPLTGAGAGAVDFKRFPVSRAGFVGGYRTVSFYNHTARDIDLTVEGRAVKLPARSYVEAKLGPTFTWSHGGKNAVTERLADGTAGLDVVFRE